MVCVLYNGKESGKLGCLLSVGSDCRDDISVQCPGGEHMLKPGFWGSNPHSATVTAPFVCSGKVLGSSEPQFPHLLNRGS